VSEKVISAMLDQRKRVEMAAQQAPMTGPNVAPPAPVDISAAPAPAAPSYADSNATYAEAPLTPPASSAYIIPYPAASYAYYGPYGYYYPYYGYGPYVSFGFRFGGHGYYGRGYYGGHGGGHAFAGGHGGHR